MTTAPQDVKNLFTKVPELISELLRLLSKKEREVIEKRFNLNHTRKHTLEEIGKSFDVTRERIRQIEKSALQKLKRNVFTTALPSIFDYAREILQEHGGVLKEEDFFNTLTERTNLGRIFDREAVRLALKLDQSFELVGNTIQLHPYIQVKNMKDIDEALIKRICFAAEKILLENGDVMKKDQLFGKISKQLEAKGKITDALISSAVALNKAIKVLKDAYGLLEWRHIHPRTLRDKIFFILREQQKPLHFVDLANQITESKFDTKRVNLQAVHNELIRCEDFILIGRGIYALKEWGYKKGTVSDVIASILKEKGEMEQEEIISEVLKSRKVKRITIMLALKNNKKITRVGRKRYRLAKS